jgi:signal transduction histidine kinase
MPSRSRFANPLSTDRGALLVAATVLAALAGAVGLIAGYAPLAAGGLLAGTVLAGAFAVHLIVSERRRHEFAEDELQAQASFLESLVEWIAAVSGSVAGEEVLERACAEAKQLFGAREARVLPAGEAGANEARIDDGIMVVPLSVRGEPIGAFELDRREPFGRGDLVRATLLADFASRAVENTRLLVEAREREAERVRLTEQLITAEQDERRRLSLFLHDGPLQSMSGIALMHDAALAAIQDGRYEDAARVIENALDRERDTIRTLRDLSFAIEPLVLRDQGFGAAVRALGDQIEQSTRITVTTDVSAGERLGEKTQVALYQIIRESITQAERRQPHRIELAVTELEDGAFAIEIADDGMGERRRAGIEAIEERTRILNARFSVEHGGEGGTLVRVVVPAYVAAAGEPA